MQVTKWNVDEIFTYHAPDEGQQANLEAVRFYAKQLAHAILNEVPACADQQAAIRHVREAVMTANAAIVLKGMV
jgi:predicted ABC-type ATPase